MFSGFLDGMVKAISVDSILKTSIQTSEEPEKFSRYMCVGNCETK